jgi:uncharacterized membrane protein
LIIAILVLAIIIIAGGLTGTIWFIWYRRRLTQGEKITTEEGLPFRWSYIIAPLAIFLLSIILSTYFYHLLPSEVAVHFELDGTPDRWLSREMTMVLALMPQLLLVLLAGGVAWGIIKLGILPEQTGSSEVKAERIVSFMGNLVALPQLVVFFAMLDILSYNSYQIHILPMWIFLLAILILVIVALGVFGVFIFSKAGRVMSQPKE